MIQKNMPEETCFTFFKESIEDILPPKRFTFPFNYSPHPLCVLAAKELQTFLEKQKISNHNFGLEKDQEGLIIGKMFGVLVVQDQSGQIGYLSGFSGKLAGSNHHDGFVPPVFDILTADGFFRKGEAIVNEINKQVDNLESDTEFLKLQELMQAEKLLAESQIEAQKQIVKKGKQSRKLKRENTEDLHADFIEELRQESLKEHYEFKDLKKYWKHRLTLLQEKFLQYQSRIDLLKEERKNKSAAVQQQIFEKYNFLNANGDLKDLFKIFRETSEINPPAGAGECAAPKLLQYAFSYKMKPIAMAEFWWGQSPASEIRMHKQFYPACRGKCEPILNHMLDGLDVDENPMLLNPSTSGKLEIVYEDEYLLLINKPVDLLSVPGIHIQDSVYERMKHKFPEATGPLIVHRLDMSTSGLMLIAKSKETHKFLQRQFINRTIKKQYLAILEGTVQENSGLINLPLRVDLDNRPHQLVCQEFGKTALTEWNVIERKDGKTRIQFSPITGRTHQLRVHAAHTNGLNAPILGDDLYGNKSDRLYLHAEKIEFKHPGSKKTMSFQVDAEF